MAKKHDVAARAELLRGADGQLAAAAIELRLSSALTAAESQLWRPQKISSAVSTTTSSRQANEALTNILYSAARCEAAHAELSLAYASGRLGREASANADDLLFRAQERSSHLAEMTQIGARLMLLEEGIPEEAPAARRTRVDAEHRLARDRC